AASAGVAALNATNVTLTTAWTSASPVPGGQPAANIAYTEGIKAAAAAAASATLAAMAGVADMHICAIPVPIPPHGPGFVTKGSSTVLINNLPAARQDDKVMEACGGADPIAMGCPTVDIGDSGGSGGGGGGSGGGSGGAGSAAPSADEAVRQEVVNALTQAGPATVEPVSIEAVGPLEPEEDEQPEEPTWLGVRLKEFDGSPVANQDVQVTLENGQTVSGQTDEEGRVKFEGLQPGQGQVTFAGIPEEEDEVKQQEKERPQQPARQGAEDEAPAEGAPAAQTSAEDEEAGAPAAAGEEDSPAAEGPSGPAGGEQSLEDSEAEEPW
ncbi:MAG: PAAR domain-containing protein, partial [Phycisphaerae bacterium]|nr:PAAR domain-containing protein [Phycisphaerae bacterium]